MANLPFTSLGRYRGVAIGIPCLVLGIDPAWGNLVEVGDGTFIHGLAPQCPLKGYCVTRIVPISQISVPSILGTIGIHLVGYPVTCPGCNA